MPTYSMRGVPDAIFGELLGGTMTTVEYALVCILAILLVVFCSAVFLYDLVRKYIGVKK